MNTEDGGSVNIPHITYLRYLGIYSKTFFTRSHSSVDKGFSIDLKQENIQKRLDFFSFSDLSQMPNPKIMHCVLLHKSVGEMLLLAYVKRCLVVVVGGEMLSNIFGMCRKKNSDF